MNEDDHDTQDRKEPLESREEYVAPALADLGSFEELTRFNAAGPSLDAEGFST